MKLTGCNGEFKFSIRWDGQSDPIIQVENAAFEGDAPQGDIYAAALDAIAEKLHEWAADRRGGFHPMPSFTGKFEPIAPRWPNVKDIEK